MDPRFCHCTVEKSDEEKKLEKTVGYEGMCAHCTFPKR